MTSIDDLVEERLSSTLQVNSVETVSPAPTERLVALVTNKRFRRTAVDDESKLDVVRKVAAAVDGNGPIEFSVPFGGYKSWHEPSAPLPNWGELFALSYLRDFGVAIAAEWQPGVRISFSYMSGVIDFVSNMPLDAQAVYLAGFEQLIRHYSDEGVQFLLKDVAEDYGSHRLIMEELQQNLDAIHDNWSARIPKDEQDKKIASAERNFMVAGVVDVTGADEAERQRIILESAMRCDALDSMSKRRAFNKFGHRIQLVYVRGPRPSVHIGSTETSANHFWVTTGVVEVRQERALRSLRRYGSLSALPNVLEFDRSDLLAGAGLDVAASGGCPVIVDGPTRTE